MHKFKHLYKIRGNTQMWAYQGLTAWYSKNNNFDQLEFVDNVDAIVINDYNANSDVTAYRAHGQLLEGHIDYWFPVDQARDCVVFAGYKNYTQYANNVTSIGFDFFDFMVHEIFSEPCFYNEVNRRGVEHAEYDVCIPVGYPRTHRYLFLQHLADTQNNLKIVTDSRQNILPTKFTFDNLNMEPYLNKIEASKFECHTTQQSFYKLGSIALMQMPHKLMHAACRVNVALETTVRDTDQPYLTEKTYKILAQARPFVIFGDRNTLQKLKSKGFKTFDKFCDESYDQEPNFAIRAKKAVDAVHQLVEACRTNPDEINEICRFNQHNYFSQERLYNELADFGKLCLDKVYIGS
jgi:hypothetical protein